jgi:hypothetical protein
MDIHVYRTVNGLCVLTIEHVQNFPPDRMDFTGQKKRKNQKTIGQET